MNKAEFSVHLYASTRIARDFAKQYTRTKLYDDFLYHLELNHSSEKTEEDQVVYPEDNLKWLRNLTHDEVVDCLWRDERVPHWINISVVYTEKKVTHIRLYCCGRYVKDQSKLYYVWDGTAPFGVKSPNLRYYPENGKGKLKKIFYEADVKKDLERLKEHYDSQESESA